ncbi:hypothetical protein RJ639_035544 [Escallonia herrerae]|uniref:Zinc finger, CCHC-type n=1 Tax=Escallonia herrerae TaxID=1293975 RepID=A0AA89B6A2_9ASTE|nr:hypothetical protein RJ639_035544 [Escallonia herrerae]
MAPNTSRKYDLKKFDGSNDFSLWRMKMHAVLIQQRLLKALKGNQTLLVMMSTDKNEDMLERAHIAMLLTLEEVWSRKHTNYENLRIFGCPTYAHANDDKEDGSHSTKENEEPQEQQYNIARNRSRREIQPPHKYGYADMVAYAQSVVGGIEAQPQGGDVVAADGIFRTNFQRLGLATMLYCFNGEANSLE